MRKIKGFGAIVLVYGGGTVGPHTNPILLYVLRMLCEVPYVIMFGPVRRTVFRLF